MDMLKKYKDWDVEFNDINEKLTTKKDEFKKQIDNNDESIYYNFTGIWGVSFKDVSKLDLSSFTAQQLSRVPFSTLTKFPEEDKLPKGFDPKKLIKNGLNSLPEDIKKLHKKGIDGSGVVVAVIDKFNKLTHKEFDGVNIEVVDRNKNFDGEDFHGLCVAAALCGKHIGVAPKSKVLFYPAVLWSEENDDNYNKILYNDMLKCLEDVLKRVKSGERIDIVSISGAFGICNLKGQQEPCEEEIKYSKIRKQLLKHNCTVITSKEFWEAGFSYSYMRDNFKDINDLDNQIEYMYPKHGRRSVLCGGKSYPLIGTEKEYIYDGTVGSASYSIPVVSGIFALAKQVDPDLNFEDFVKAALSTSVKNKDGVNFVNALALCKKVESEKTERKTL